ncbi:hypothetical protein ACFL0F_02435 [Patescibacteria group bacterium]
MQPLVKKSAKREQVTSLTSNEKLSIKYHDIFDYPMTLGELVKWRAQDKLSKINVDRITIDSQNGLYFLKGRSGLMLKRSVRKRASSKKMKIAQKAVKLLSKIPTVRMVGVTGALAMENATEESDIDLLIICSKGSLWTTRMLSWLILKATGRKIRKPMDKKEKDKLCLNMWLDESDLVWRKRNIFTAHEIAQTIPLIDKGGYYKTFLGKNKWIKEYWPNAVNVPYNAVITDNISGIGYILYSLVKLVEPILFRFQKNYMKGKITKEIIKPTRAVFHPNDLSLIVLSRLR